MLRLDAHAPTNALNKAYLKQKPTPQRCTERRITCGTLRIP